jgi:hypothetical protein
MCISKTGKLKFFLEKITNLEHRDDNRTIVPEIIRSTDIYVLIIIIIRSHHRFYELLVIKSDKTVPVIPRLS